MTTSGKMVLWTALISTSLTIITTFTILALTNSREDKISIRNELSKKADIEYVDKLNLQIKQECNDRINSQEAYFEKQYNSIIIMLTEQGNYIRSIKK